MAGDSKLKEFIERAKASGVSEESLVGILTARGWPEKEVYEALASHYERATGVEIPTRGGTGTAAKDAFFYLLIFASLSTWTIGLGSLAFTLIDKWFADRLFPGSSYNQAYESYSVAGALASILVAFPLYLVVSRIIVGEVRNDPEKLDSPVRKWLTYLALVLAAGVMVGDLITALTYLLRGEITSRFIAKASVVLMLSGGVFFYYFGGLRKTESAEGSGWSRDALMAAVSAIAVAAMVTLGFWHIGAPKTQRTLRADEKRVQDLWQLSTQINIRWNSRGHKLPEHLDELTNVALADPLTRMAYEYHVKEGSEYELCGTFAADSRAKKNDAMSRPSKWAHPAGRYCFALNAAETPENPNIYLPY